VQSKALGAYLRYLREQRGLEEAEAARRSKIKSTGRWYEYEAGEQSTKKGKVPARPSLKTALAIADGLELTDDEAKQLFELAGYGDLWQQIGERAVRTRGDGPTLDEALRARGTLTKDEREAVVNHVEGIEALKQRREREAR